MPRKAKNKPMTNATLTYKLSAATEQFLTAMDQNHHVASTFTSQELLTRGGFNWVEIRDDLTRMNFTEVDASTQDNSTTIEIDNNNDILSYEELSPAGELTNAIAAFRQWFEGNNIPDKEHPGLINNIRTMPHLAATSTLTTSHPLHHNNKDTPMEPSTPTHVFSKAASQTPAPSHKASTPPPPPTTAATLPAAVTSSASAGPSPPFVCGPPHAPEAIPTQNPQPILNKCSKQPFFTTCGPMCRQFYIEAPTIPSNTSLPSLVNTANCALTCARSTLKVDSAYISPCGITCVTASIPSTLDLNIIEATLSGGLLGVHISIPASRSFIKIVDVPFFQDGTTTPFSNAEVDTQLQCSIIPSDYVVHWHYVWNSPKADSATIWIDLANSQ
ncbi:hypothetical protein P691DRAFT_768695 [Macrolepiota fuliginosa MF-IS2]|uniref:Uncharacterized protein n=1 Tax=Macrolepiota fuliginosa MF-IS2 TaxID=1400762 RepID=A0A9P5WW21_9AGAR|nr:hypothetical protein P691DRAFT_768695 [Macrolepiota fuliginosa MF-IS2]